MSTTLPYLSSPGTTRNLLEKIKAAAVPSIVNQEYVQNTLGIKGGSGAVCPPFLKRIGFLTPNGSPTELYKNFRNPSLSGIAVAQAIRHAYTPLYAMNEKWYELSESELRGLIIQATGSDSEARSVDFIRVYRDSHGSPGNRHN